MELKQIHYFTEVVKQGSFSKAAEQLYISQPNISNVIKDLEKELDVTLLIRTTRKVELTDTGKLLFQYGQQIFQSLQFFHQELDDMKNRKKGSIKIGIFPMLGMHFFTEILAEFHKRYPGISIRFEEDGAYNLKKSLIQGELDLVVMPLPIEKEEFNFLPFLKGDLRLLVHKNHALANKEEVAWSDLQNEDFIIFREGFSIRDTIFEECKRLGFEPTIICESSQWNFMIEMVSIKQGIAILPQSTQKEIDYTDKHIKVLRLTDPQINWHLGIAWRKESYISNATKTWINFVKERLKL
ncbi:LysR family transcriptional regulator [Metabacillus rhizolycopersici]|jgi:DNA-binding transcriptional LysR family regulator|uniref:LysR family transcriptional regulator n=1 Tax=Metabacillus rhizolycopersici TaxID=2875709 RepID=A0ABS7UVM2_9BACI|nr:LysR family transcriptional regulator [Metabacillus rhizolycopersici]MBZ5752361.1 LysR family transcriptional regulator [Metabacillus rhizolycopersici]